MDAHIIVRVMPECTMEDQQGANTLILWVTGAIFRARDAAQTVKLYFPQIK